MPNNKHIKNNRNGRDDDQNNNQPVNNPREIMENHNAIVDENSRFQHCCVPTGCSDDPIDERDPYDAVKVICNNDSCTEGTWMHKTCFAIWEQSVLSYLRSCGRARSWSEKQRLQNLWTKKGYDLAYKACDCKCGRGHLRKDLDFVPPPANDCARKHKKNKKKNDKPMPVVSTNHKSGHNSNTANPYHAQTADNHHHIHHPSHPEDSYNKLTNRHSTVTEPPMSITARPGINGANGHPMQNVSLVSSSPGNIKIRNRNNSLDQHEILDNIVHIVPYTDSPLMLRDSDIRLRTNSVSSTGSVSSQTSSSGSVADSTRSISPLSTSPVNENTFMKGKRTDNLDSTQCVFRHRQNLSAFRVLPRSKQNPYNIHIEDTEEDEDARNFVLSSLTNKRMTALRCVMCKTHLPVFDRFPLIDGTMFLSPQAYDHFVVQVIWEGRIQFLNAVCISCLEGASEARCSACKTPWNGTSFVVGTMYTYDIFAAMPCCQKRLTCKHCRRAVVDVSVGLYYYSQYSRMIICPYCKANDYHFIRSLNDTFSLKEH